MRIRNTLAIFLVSGFWHGANWTFLAWGAIHAVLFIPLLLSEKNRRHLEVVAADAALPSISESLQMVQTFVMVTFAWIFFRARDVGQALVCLERIFSATLLQAPVLPSATAVGGVLVVLLLEWRGRRGRHALEGLAAGRNRWTRWPLYFALIWAVLLLRGTTQEFIYFQF